MNTEVTEADCIKELRKSSIGLKAQKGRLCLT